MIKIECKQQSVMFSSKIFLKKILQLLLLSVFISAFQAKAEINKNFKILSDGICNNNRKLVISTTPGDKIKLVSDNEILAKIYFACKSSYHNWITTYHTNKHGLRNINISNKNKQFVYAGRIPLDKQGKKVFANYTQKIELEEDGRIKFTISTKVPKAGSASYKAYGLYFSLPFALYSGTQYKINGKDFSFPKKNAAKYNLLKMSRFKNKPINITLLPGTKSEYSIILETGAFIQ
ncbi:MAG: hypothetical protein KOO69_06650, partial [Victivallales bacterium]|nr:hypothetical protein [Victivallales bacterium]